MTTKEVEERLGITRQTLIYYENEGFISPQRNQNNYRNYDEQDIIKLQTVMELRNMKISVDDIKRIFRGDISIKDILDEKQQDLLSDKKKIDEITQSISQYLQIIKVNIVKDDNISNSYPNLFIKDDHLQIDQMKIYYQEIYDIDVSLCLSKGEQQYYKVLNMYFVIIYINTRKKCYKIELMNNSQVSYLFNILLQHCIMHDPIGLIDIYQQYQDPYQLNQYINKHYQEWKKEYHLNEHIDNYYDVMKKTFMDPLQEAKNSKPTIRGEFKLLGQLYWQYIKKLLRIK